MAFTFLLLASNLAPLDGRGGAFRHIRQRGFFCVEKRRKERPMQMKPRTTPLLS
jgi:hypothetical protein